MKGFNKIWRLLLSSPKVSVGDPLFLKKENDRFPTTTFGNDNEFKNGNDRFPNAPRRLTLGNDKRKRLLIKQAVILNLFQNLHFGPFVVTVLSRLIERGCSVFFFC